MRIALSLFLSLFFVAGAPAQSGTLTNAEAQDIMLRDWNALTGNLLIGERTVGRNLPPQDCKSEVINEEQFEFLLSAEIKRVNIPRVLDSIQN